MRLLIISWRDWSVLGAVSLLFSWPKWASCSFIDLERTCPRWGLFPEEGGGPALPDVPEIRVLLPLEAETGPFPIDDNLEAEVPVLIDVAVELDEEFEEEWCRRVGRSGRCCSISATVGRPWPSRLNFSVPAARWAEERRLDGLEGELFVEVEEEKAPVPGPKAKVELAVEDAESRDIFGVYGLWEQCE